MSDATESAAALNPNSTPTPPPQVAPNKVPAGARDPEEEPVWLADRLARKEKAIAKRFGVESIDDIETKIRELNELREKVKPLEEAIKERDELKASVERRVELELAGLSEEQRKVITETHRSPQKRLELIDRLRPTWAAQAAPKPLPAPANTTPAPSAPAETATTSGPNHFEKWQALKAQNPAAAAVYLSLHQSDILAQKQARGK